MTGSRTGLAVAAGLALSLAVTLAAGAAQAALCDFRLSELIGARAPALASETADQSSLKGLGGKSQDFFTLVDQGGLTALGAVMGGKNGALAAGAAEEAAKVLGISGTVVTSQTIGIAAGVAALGAVGLEGVCRFQDERITDYYEVLAVLSAVAETADPRMFQLQLGTARKKAAVVEIWDAQTGIRQQYRVADLFFVNGELKLNRIGFNKSLGWLVQFRGDTPALDTPPLDAFKP
ncbi:hypothetical protein [Neotabrizicola sp. VNH66]|uniref:hypothetical protein n=1 Tax=Neotabrizicola sp. VNH66 TaxID=3400918 RepID=UPI003BFC7491